MGETQSEALSSGAALSWGRAGQGSRGPAEPL